MTLHLPKKYLSYSAIFLWYKNKDQFRKKYYEGIYPPDTKFTLFGKEVEKRIYAGEFGPDMPLFGAEQHEIRLEIEGVPIVGYLDSFHAETHKFLDYKTSLKPWTQVMVQKLDQLTFYSFLIEQKYGSVDPDCLLVWLETMYVPSKGLLSSGDTVDVSGKFEIFTRKIAKWERKRMVPYIVDAAREISEDYTSWLKTNTQKQVYKSSLLS